jgi:hypothetical protein
MLLNHLDNTFVRHISSTNLNALVHDLVHFLDFVGTKTWLGNAPMQVGQPLYSVKKYFTKKLLTNLGIQLHFLLVRKPIKNLQIGPLT